MLKTQKGQLSTTEGVAVRVWKQDFSHRRKEDVLLALRKNFSALEDLNSLMLKTIWGVRIEDKLSYETVEQSLRRFLRPHSAVRTLSIADKLSDEVFEWMRWGETEVWGE